MAAATIHALVQRFRQDEPPLTLPTHGGKRGHPVLISATLIPEIQATRDPDTLKTIVYRHLPHAALVEGAGCTPFMKTWTRPKISPVPTRETPTARNPLILVRNLAIDALRW